MLLCPNSSCQMDFVSLLETGLKAVLLDMQEFPLLVLRAGVDWRCGEPTFVATFSILSPGAMYEECNGSLDTGRAAGVAVSDRHVPWSDRRD